MLRPLDLSDPDVADRVVAIQRAAYRVEADLIGFDGIPPLHDTVVVSTGTANAPARALCRSLGFVVTGERAIADGVTVTSYRLSTGPVV